MDKNIPFFIKNRLLWFLPLLMVAGALYLTFVNQQSNFNRQNMNVAIEGARNMFRSVVLTRAWNASHGGVYVPITDKVQPNEYLDVPNRDITTTTGTELTLINPAYMTRLIAEMAAKEEGVVFRITSLNPLRPKNAPDEWEAKALHSFERGQQEAIEVTPFGPRNELALRYMAPLLVTEACMNCHAHQGYQIGDIRGGISVSQKYQPLQAASEEHASSTSQIYSAAFVLIVIVAGTLLEALRRRWFALANNIHELETTRKELVHSEKMASLGRVVAGFAHEINTPIGIAVGAVSQGDDTVRRITKMLDQEEVEEAVLRAELSDLQLGGELAMSNLNRAADLVRSFKRTAIDQASDQVRVFSVHEMIEDVFKALKHQLKRLPILININCDAALLIEGAPGLLEQVITNLVMNSVVHGFDNGARGGTIQVLVARQHNDLILRYSDDGIGMTTEQASHVFEPFYTTNRHAGGSGLGLFICYDIITEKLGGKIDCASSPQAGCKFTMSFPAKFVSTQGDANP